MSMEGERGKEKWVYVLCIIGQDIKHLNITTQKQLFYYNEAFKHTQVSLIMCGVGTGKIGPAIPVVKTKIQTNTKCLFSCWCMT